MKIINFDEKFQEYVTKWMQENEEKYKNNIDRMEAKMPEVYLQWLNTPAVWLDGAMPGTYFAQESDPAKLIAWMLSYFTAKVPVPDQLLERITDLGQETEQALASLVSDANTPHDARLTAITLLTEMESVLPQKLYIEWIMQREAEDELAEMAAEALVAQGREVVKPVLACIDEATVSGREAFLDILCNFPGEERIYELAITMFRENSERRALFASFLGKLGDERALPVLRAAMDDPEINYLDYIELRNALEAIGGDAPAERSFDGDPFYESLRKME